MWRSRLGCDLVVVAVVTWLLLLLSLFLLFSCIFFLFVVVCVISCTSLRSSVIRLLLLLPLLRCVPLLFVSLCVLFFLPIFFNLRCVFFFFLFNLRRSLYALFSKPSCSLMAIIVLLSFSNLPFIYPLSLLFPLSWCLYSLLFFYIFSFEVSVQRLSPLSLLSLSWRCARNKVSQRCFSSH